MPKKGENSKAVEARARKEEGKRSVAAKQKSEADDREWAAAGEGSKTKAQAKKQDQAKQREDAAAKKAEAKRLADEEAASMSTVKPAKQKAAAPKVTAHQIALQKEADRKLKDAEQQEAQRASKRDVTEDSYEAMVASPNVNKQADEASARTVNDAIALLSVEDGATTPEDRHPERRAKAAYAAFTDRELPQLKLDRPGLKQSQYKDMLWKQWQKAPENPFNRAAV